LYGKGKFFSVTGLILLVLAALVFNEGERISARGRFMSQTPIDSPGTPEYVYRENSELKDKNFQRVMPVKGNIPPFAESILCPSIAGMSERFLRGKSIESVLLTQGGRASQAVSSVVELSKFYTNPIGISRLQAQIVQRK
jgi:hypothetical protein